MDSQGYFLLLFWACFTSRKDSFVQASYNPIRLEGTKINYRITLEGACARACVTAVFRARFFSR